MVTRTINTDPELNGQPLLGTHVTFRFAQRGRQPVGYIPPNWISRNNESTRYLLNIDMDVDYKHPRSIE